MKDETKLEIIKELAKGNVKIAQLILEVQGDNIFNENKDKENEVPSSGLRQSVIEYVNRLMPVVAVEYREQYSKIWMDILEEEAVRCVIYNRGKQQGTVFNRNLVAQISRMMALDGIIVKETNDVMMAELLEPEKGKHHPVRNQLGLVPDDERVKKAVEAVFKRYGVEVP